jgi:hypothetical protein
MEFREGDKGKRNDRDSTTSLYITSVKVEDIRMCIENG